MIKKITLLFVFILNFNGLNAQENILKIGALTGNIGVQYERSLDDDFSLIGQIGYADMGTTVNNAATEDSTGLGVYVEGRYYFSSNKDLMEGWHAGVFFSYINTKNVFFRTNISSLGIVGGYQWVLDSKLTIDVFLGGGTINVDSSNSFIVDDLKSIGFLPRLGLTLGYNF